MLRNAIPLILLACFIANSVSAKIWRVNNNVGVTANFTTLSAAVSSASVLAGDTLHVEASLTTYGNLNLTKRLVVLGTGYFLDLNPKTQANTNSAIIGELRLAANASGSVVMGLTINGFVLILDPNNVVIARNKINNDLQLNPFNLTGSSTNVLIQDNYMSQIYFGSANNNTSYSNLRVENNIILGTGGIDLIALGAVTSGQIINNYFVGATKAENCLIKNNFIASFPGTAGSNVVQYNIFATNNTNFVGTNGNITASAATVFVNPVGNQDAGFMLKAGSPGFGAGRDANGNPTDIGPFGNANPYVLSGMPPIPNIYLLTVPQNVPAGTPSMNVTISTISHN